MDALFYIFGILILFILPLATIFILLSIIRPRTLGIRKHTDKPTRRGKIAAVGLSSLVVAFIGLSIGLVSTEPQSIKADQATQAAVAEKAQKEAQLSPNTLKSEKLVDDTTKSQPIVKTETKNEVIIFDSTERNDATITKGERKISVYGVNGETTVTYNVTYKDGIETSRAEKSRLVTKQPVTQVTLVGTYVKPVVKAAPAPAPKPSSSCDPNYSGACVPIASDVDCAGGSGNGPAYVRGPVRVIGRDIYGLDRDGDGIGCE